MLRVIYPEISRKESRRKSHCRKFRSIVRACLVLSLSLLLVGTSGCQRFSVQYQLEKHVEQLKAEQSLPRKITEQLTLIDIQAGDREMIQVFKVKGPLKRLKKKADELETQALVEMRKNKGRIQNLIDYKIVMTFRYLHDPSEEVVHTFQVEPWNDL